jgi:hypothetical protein
MRILIALLFLCNAGSAQLIFLPKDYCEHLKIEPNLHLQSNTTIRATMKDRSGDVFKNTPVELRRFVNQQKQEPIASTNTDSKGEFTFADVPRGEYRILVTDARTRGFRQPSEMWCKSNDLCVLEIVLEVMPTDMPESQCPVK